jgi:hypothetical protein
MEMGDTQLGIRFAWWDNRAAEFINLSTKLVIWPLKRHIEQEEPADES